MTLTDYYKYSWFSNMAYVEWDENNISNPSSIITTADEQDRIPANLGDIIFSKQHWTIPSYQPNDSTGFAANVFTNEQTNEKVLAIRGTEAGTGYPIQTITDLVAADLGEIGLAGLALNQAVSLFNYVQRLRADATDTQVLRVDLKTASIFSVMPSPVPDGVQSVSVTISGITTYFWFDVYHDAQGLGMLDETDQVTVTGHSLGGHLAALAARLFPDLFDQAVLFNAAGFDPITSLKLTDEIVDLFGAVLSNEGQAMPVSSFAGLPIFNLEAEDSAPGDDINIVASLITGIPAGVVQDIRTENNSHSMDQMMDALGVMSLLEKLNPLMPRQQIFILYDALANQSGDTEETLLEKLSRFFLFNDTPLDTVEAGLVSHGDFSVRSANHERLLQLEAAIKDQGYVLESIAHLATVELVANARNSLAWSYALKELNPFVITNADALYAAHNQNHALEVYDATNNPAGLLTEQYLEDRAELLTLIIKRNLEDISNDENVTKGFDDKYYQDVDQNIIIIPGGYRELTTERVVFGADSAADILTGGNRDDHLFGQKGDDVLIGGNGMDYLEGGEGDDVLDGREDAISTANGGDPDILNGGQGFDTYLPGLGDRIVDSDGQGRIYVHDQYINIGNITLAAAGGTIYTNNDEAHPVRFQMMSDGTLQVIGSYFTIQDFTNGDFGINLDPDMQLPQLNIIEGTEFSDRLGTADMGASDGIGGTENADEMHGLAGDDEMDGFEGDDVMFGEDGDDVLIGNFGHDVMDGGAGRDAILSGIGRDILLGGLGDDFLSGFDEEDYIEGGAGNDFLAGGADTDALLGGAGNDVLFGDAVFFAADRTWQVNVMDTTPGVAGGKEISFNASVTGVYETGTDQDVADFLDGGEGDDVLFGGFGNDQLYGGADNDDLEGNAGDDFLDGGTGDDGLWGDTWDDPAVAGNDTLQGGVGNDYLAGGGGNDVLRGGADNDRLFGDETEVDPALHGQDTLYGDEGDDILIGQGGADVLFGGDGDDVLRGDSATLAAFYHGDDILDGGAGNDLLEGGGGADTLLGGSGMDTLDGGNGNDNLTGGDGNDLLAGQDGDDVVHGDAGDDEVQGNAGHDQLFGDDGNDRVFGMDGDDQLHGGMGNDELIGDAGVDILDGGEGNDALCGGADNDILNGGAGLDTLQGGDGDDILTGGADRDLLFGGVGHDVLEGGDGDDQLVGDAGNDTLSGGTGIDWIFGGDGNDILSGGADNDELQGGNHSDFLNGGAGNDTLRGDAGSDIYHFARGDGQDVISNYDPNASATGPASGKVDILRFAAGISPDEISATRDPAATNTLQLKINSTTDQIKVLNYFTNAGESAYRLERIEFSDGTVWTPQTIPLLIQGTAASETLIGTSLPEVFDGGAGNDRLVGGAGNDTYRFGRGYGQDIVEDSDSTQGNFDRVYILADTLPADVKVARSGSHLVLSINGTSDRITLRDYFVNDGTSAATIEQIKFAADGTVWDVNMIKQMVLVPTEGNDTIIGYATNDTLNGLGGDDTLEGMAGNDTLNGGSGNDRLLGGTGDDTYLFGRGFGVDNISDLSSTTGNGDTILLAADVLLTDVTLQRVGGLILSIKGTADKLTVDNYFVNDGANTNVVEYIRFLSDGTVWDINTVKFKVLTGTADDDFVIGYATDDTLTGLAGNDTMNGNAGNDFLDGGPGNDSQQGGLGNDVFLFARGDGTDSIIDNPFSYANRNTGVDVLRFAPGILPEEVSLIHQGAFDYRLTFHVSGSSDYITVENYFYNDGMGPLPLERVEFADGMVWDAGTIRAKLLMPTEGNDILVGFYTNDVILGLGGNDRLEGSNGDDVLDGGTGNDILAGNNGNDTYLFTRGGGRDIIVNYPDASPDTTMDTLKFAADILPGDITVSRENLDLVLTINGTTDAVVLREYLYGYYAMDRIEFGDSTVWTVDTVASMFPLNGTAGDDTLQGYFLPEQINGLGGNDIIRGGGGNDTLDGGPGTDTLFGDDGNDTLVAGQADGTSDNLHGGSGNDILISSGDKVTDFLYGDMGHDIYFGGLAADWMEDTGNNNLFHAGANNDQLWGGNNNDLYIGGGDTDFIDGDRNNDGITGNDLILFNRGDKSDNINRVGAAPTLSLGGGILYSQLKLVHIGNMLTLKVGGKEQLSFSEWYSTDPGNTPNRVKYLQIVIEGTRSYDPASANPWENQKVVVFDFTALVAAFDTAQSSGQRFNVSAVLANYYVWGSDSMAYGGAVAYEYAINGTLDNLAYADMQNILADPVFGQAPQSFTLGVQSVELATQATIDTSSTLRLAETMDSPYLLSGAEMNLWQGIGRDAWEPQSGAGRGHAQFNNQVDQLVQALAGFGATYGHGWVSLAHAEVETANAMQLAANWQQAA